MKIETSVVIDAAQEKVWKEFIRFDNYEHWNPFIRNIKGTLHLHRKIRVEVKGMKQFNAKIIAFEPKRQLAWYGKLLVPGLFDGRHSFELIANIEESTTFIQKERFLGLLIPLFKGKMEQDTKKGFMNMNLALKKLVENSDKQ